MIAQKKRQSYRIEICGGIATGKTTLAERLAKRMKIDLVREFFTEVPFWKEAYELRGKKCMFEKNIGFLLFHAHLIFVASNSGRNAICDFASFQDLSYADLSTKPSDIAALEYVFNRFTKGLPEPVIVIDLVCSEGTQLERIRLRGREPEKGIDANFLRRLRKAIVKRGKFDNRHRSKVIRVNSNKTNFRDEDCEVQKIQNQILELIDRL